MSSVQSIIAPTMPAGVFVRHACPGALIELVSYRDGQHRSLTVSEKRALGLVQQLTAMCVENRPFRIYDQAALVVGDIAPDQTLKVIADLANAIRINRHHAEEQRRHEG